MSRLGTLSGHLAELTAGAEPGQSLSSRLSVPALHLVLICRQGSLALSHATDKPQFSWGLIEVLKSEPLSRLPSFRAQGQSCGRLLTRDSSTQPVEEQSLSENEGLQMPRKQIDKFALQGWLSLFSLFVQLNKPFYGFSWKSSWKDPSE